MNCEVNAVRARNNSQSDSGYLLRLSKLEDFTLNVCLSYLSKKLEPGVHDYLVNKLYSYPDREINFYLPQICYLLIQKQTSSMERFILDKCKEHLIQFLKVSQYFLVALSQIPV